MEFGFISFSFYSQVLSVFFLVANIIDRANWGNVVQDTSTPPDSRYLFCGTSNGQRGEGAVCSPAATGT